MTLYKVWLQDTPEKGLRSAGDVAADSPRAAAEQAHGGPLAAFGPLHMLRAQVVRLEERSARADSFFRLSQKR